MRNIFLLALFSLTAVAQTTVLTRPDPINLIPPATNAAGSVIAFAAATAPDGTPDKGTNLYVFDQELHRRTNYSGESNWTGITSVTHAAGFTGFTAQPSGPDGPEEVHLLDALGLNDRTLVTDKEGCVQVLCVNCLRSCLGPVHLSPDAGRVLYSVARNQPFSVVNADGSGRRQLPVYIGALAASAQRVISRNGQVVFVSAAPSGPTFAAAAVDIYLINLDGTGLRQVTKFGNARFAASRATISADGSLIAFESNFSESGAPQANQIWVVRADGTNLRRLSSGGDEASSPSISADGSIVVYLQRGQILRAKTSGDPGILPLTKLVASVARDAVVSDDGSRVAFTLGPQNGSSAAVYRIPADVTSDTRSFETIYAPRFINANGVVSAAGYGAASPGSLISLYGVNLGPDEMEQARGFPLPLSLNGLTVSVNGQRVPLVAQTPWQINLQLPQNIAPGMATFQVNYAGVIRLADVRADIKSTAPAVLTFPTAGPAVSYVQAAAFHAGTAIPADVDHPATAGETLEIYGLGLGVTNPAPEAGLPSPALPPARAVQMPRVQIGNRDAAVTFAGLTPGLAGVYQVNAIVPPGLAPGLHPLSWMGPDGAAGYASIAVK
jgi:uncharacterized protein (TIGR03437 family)